MYISSNLVYDRVELSRWCIWYKIVFFFLIVKILFNFEENIINNYIRRVEKKEDSKILSRSVFLNKYRELIIRKYIFFRYRKYLNMEKE